jgi:rod shape-determining protein MreD
MNEFNESLPVRRRGKKKRSRLRPWVMLVAPLAAILFQVYVPLYLSLLEYLELPLLVTVYFAVTRRSQVAGVFIGAGIGLVQDSLSHQPIGIFGMVKTLVGYLAASLGVRLDTEHIAVRFGLGFFFCVCHQFLYWAVRRTLLGDPAAFEYLQTLLAALSNGTLAVPLFYLLDRLKESE